MINTTVYVGTTNNKDFFNIPPERKKNNEFLKKREEKTKAEQILNKVFPGLNFSKSNKSVNDHKGDDSPKK